MRIPASLAIVSMSAVEIPARKASSQSVGEMVRMSKPALAVTLIRSASGRLRTFPDHMTYSRFRAKVTVLKPGCAQ